jgi:quinol monooxygenase YgiN
LRVVARIIAQPDHVDKVKSLLSELIEPTRREAGCILYELLQNKSDPADFTFVEEWESDDALDAHAASAHIKSVTSRLTGLIGAPPDVRRYVLVR